MNIFEWKRKYSQKQTSQYTHFDRRTSLDRCFTYITSRENIKKHGFYPFIHYTIKNRVVKHGKKTKPKEREIYYAAHIDGWIYRYYAHLINEAYNQRVEIDGINSVAVAYRTNLKQSNIDFAHKAFQYIRNTGPCHVIIGDFTDFFDNLDHAYLKQQLCDLLSVDRLPEDIFAVYKNITRFSYVELKDLLELNELPDTKLGRKAFNAYSRERALSTKEFRKNKNIIHASPHPKCGVPQGSPISAVLANVYMLAADRRIHEYVSLFSGFYMRYSDDFIIVLQKNSTDFSEHYEKIKTILNSIPNLILKESKTRIFLVDKGIVQNHTTTYLANTINTKNIIEFLGFSFDGKHVRIRDKTISRYYNKLYRKLQTIINNYGVTPYPHKHRISCKNLYRQYSYKGSRHYLRRKIARTSTSLKKDAVKGNFLDYIYKSKKKFKGDPIDTSTKKHMQKIRKRLKYIYK